MHAALLIPLYLCAALLPLALAWLGAREARPFWDELASGAGLLAFSIILVDFVLSGRFQIVSRRIGMDVTMRIHQLLARTALVLALLHPFLYQSPFNPARPWDPTRKETLTGDLESLTSGVLAWVLLGAFVALSIGRDRIGYRYETWRLMHGVGAALIAALTLHHTLHAGRYSADPALAATWIAMFFIAIATLVFVYLVRPLSQRRRPWRVREVKPLGLKTWGLTIEPVGHTGLDYTAGQFVWLNVGASPFSLDENPFSIASAPSSGASLDFIIKELGDSTSATGAVRPGERAYIDGPHGNLTVEHRREKGFAFIAGGVGVAPLLGILKELQLCADPRPSLLIYGNRVAEQIVAGDDLRQLWGAHGTEIRHVLSEPPPDWPGEIGLIDAALMRRLFRDEMKDWLFVLCGPAAMMETVEDALIELGVPASQILSERFQYD